MCAACGCGKKKGEPGFGKGSKSKAKGKKAATKKMSPKQSKLDSDKDGKLEGSDFAALKKKKK